jgi:hypothetical protein
MQQISSSKPCVHVVDDEVLRAESCAGSSERWPAARRSAPHLRELFEEDVRGWGRRAIHR